MYLNDINFRTHVRMIPALSCVLIEDTVTAFDQLAAHCGNLEQPVLDYFETNYVGELRRGRRLEPLFPHALWNMNARVEDNLPRTNNDIEGWHSGFAVMFRYTHPPVWQFIDVLNLWDLKGEEYFFCIFSLIVFSYNTHAHTHTIRAHWDMVPEPATQILR